MVAPRRAGRVDRNELLRDVDLESLLDALSGPAQRRRWRCPEREHPDQHPSVTVTTGADGIQRWRCWSGGHHGTAIDAVMAAHHVSAGDAIGWLAERHGHWPAIERPAPPPPREIGAPSSDVIEYVQRAEKLLVTATGRPHREWLHQRGLGDEVLHANRVGADPGRRYLPRPRGLPAGWPAVVYPALSPGGAITYFQARYLDPPAHRSKYDNPARVHATNPRIAWLRPVGDHRPGTLVITEGIADGLIAAQAGFDAAGILGCGIADERLAADIADQVIRRSPVPEVAICLDADTAGRDGASRLEGLLASYDVTARVVLPGCGTDLTDWATTDPRWADSLGGDSRIDEVGPVARAEADSPAARGAVVGWGQHPKVAKMHSTRASSTAFPS